MNEFQQLSTYLTEHILSTYNSSGLVQTNKLENILNECVVRVVNEGKSIITCDNGCNYLSNYFDFLVEKHIVKLEKYYK